MNEDKAARYHRFRRRATAIGTTGSAVLLLLLLLSGASAWLRDVSASVAHASFLLTTVVYVFALGLVIELIQLPRAFYLGVALERRYGLSTQTTGAWWVEHAKAGSVALFCTVPAAILVVALLRWSPERWWVIAAFLFTGLLVVLAHLVPVVILPVLYDTRPLRRDGLSRRLVALAERAGTHVIGAYEWRLGGRTRRANAALVGLGRRRRILLSDTLLAEHSDDEIEVILAHELAHAVHHDIWRGIAVEFTLMLTGFYVADRVLVATSSWFGFTTKSDVAVIPLLMLAGGAVWVALVPVFNALSRAQERRADRYALEMTRNVPAFVSAMRRLGAQNLVEDRPSRLVELIFHSHPPVSARMLAAQAWAARNGQAPTRSSAGTP